MADERSDDRVDVHYQGRNERPRTVCMGSHAAAERFRNWVDAHDERVKTRQRRAWKFVPCQHQRNRT